MTPECDGLASITSECWQRIVEYWIRFDVNNINGNWNWTLVTEIISDEANPRIGRLFGTVQMEGIIVDERCNWKGRDEMDKERQWEETDWLCKPSGLWLDVERKEWRWLHTVPWPSNQAAEQCTTTAKLLLLLKPAMTVQMKLSVFYAVKTRQISINDCGNRHEAIPSNILWFDITNHTFYGYLSWPPQRAINFLRYLAP